VSTTVVLDMFNPRAGEKPRDVVMGLVTNHIWEVIPGGIGLFIVSLRQSRYRGDIVLGVDTKQAKDPKILQNFKKWKCTAVLADATQYDPNFLPKMPVASRRYLFYDTWLEKFYSPQDRVLLIDVRDTMFQLVSFAACALKIYFNA
jgi:hypothetical protein